MQTTAKVQRNRAAQLNQKMYLKREYELVCSGNTKKEKYMIFFFQKLKVIMIDILNLSKQRLVLCSKKRAKIYVLLSNAFEIPFARNRELFGLHKFLSLLRKEIPTGTVNKLSNHT